jgi:hypothetical protein
VWKIFRIFSRMVGDWVIYIWYVIKWSARELWFCNLLIIYMMEWFLHSLWLSNLSADSLLLKLVHESKAISSQKWNLSKESHVMQNHISRWPMESLTTTEVMLLSRKLPFLYLGSIRIFSGFWTKRKKDDNNIKWCSSKKLE